jgi:hypothetical protein
MQSGTILAIVNKLLNVENEIIIETSLSSARVLRDLRAPGNNSGYPTINF